MKQMKRAFLLLIALIMGGTAFFVPIPSGWSGEGEPEAPQSSREAMPATPFDKEEVVYASFLEDGQVEDVYVVNILSAPGGGLYQDYGEYREVKNLSTSEEIQENNGVVTIQSTSSRLYYQGYLDQPQLPFLVHISYTLDGQALSGQELAGKSGLVSIHISVTQNEKAPASFFEGCALQVSLTLDGDLATDIVAEGATIANAGKNKQLSYTALPGQGLDATISMQANGFRMDRIQINGIALSLDLQVNLDEFTGSLGELTEGIRGLDDGMGQLAKGSAKLHDGTSQLTDGVGEIQEGVAPLTAGIQELVTGIRTMGSGLSDHLGNLDLMQEGLTQMLDNKENMTEGSAAFYDGLKALQSGLNVSLGQLGDMQALSEALSQLKTGSQSVKEGINALYKTIQAVDVPFLLEENTAAAAQLETLAETLGENDPGLGDIALLLTQNNQALTALQGAQHALADEGALATGATAVASGIAQLEGSIGTLAEKLASLMTQLQTLRSGLSQMVSQYELLDQGILSLYEGVTQLNDHFGLFYDGMISLVGGLSAMDGKLEDLVTGTQELSGGINALYGGMQSLQTGIKEAKDGTNRLKEGTGTLRRETAGMEGKVSDEMQRILEDMTGGDVKLQSFADLRNQPPKSVQFIMATKPIEEEEPAPTPPPEAIEKTAWDRFLELFQ